VAILHIVDGSIRIVLKIHTYLRLLVPK